MAVLKFRKAQVGAIINPLVDFLNKVCDHSVAIPLGKQFTLQSRLGEMTVQVHTQWKHQEHGITIYNQLTDATINTDLYEQLGVDSNTGRFPISIDPDFKSTSADNIQMDVSIKTEKVLGIYANLLIELGSTCVVPDYPRPGQSTVIRPYRYEFKDGELRMWYKDADNARRSYPFYKIHRCYKMQFKRLPVTND